jgi:hypothetical protein
VTSYVIQHDFLIPFVYRDNFCCEMRAILGGNVAHLDQITCTVIDAMEHYPQNQLFSAIGYTDFFTVK